MSTAAPILSMFSLPGGNGKYLDTLVEFLTWLSGRSTTNRMDARDWFDSRYGAAKSAPYYLPVLRDLGVIEMDRGKDGAIRLMDLGRRVLDSDREGQLNLVADRFVRDFAANREILNLYSSATPLSLQELRTRLGARFPSWTSSVQYEYRLCWFDSLNLLRAVRGRTFEITPRGAEFARKYPPLEVILPARVGESNESCDARPTEAQPSIDHLVAELRSASTDSSKPTRFETALARAFETLGYAVNQLGESGDTDVLAEAVAGNASYRIVADAKSRGTGKVDQLEVLSLKDHQALNEAQYAVVVAGSFAAGKVAAHAAEQGITLLPLGVLESWLRLHDAWPQDLLAYRSIFSTKGLVEKLPAELLQVTSDRKRWGKLLADIVDLFSETYEHGLSEPLTPRDVFRMLVTRKRGVPYPEPDVTGILELLSHPVVGALIHRDGGYILVMSRETLGLRLRRLAEEVEILDSVESS